MTESIYQSDPCDADIGIVYVLANPAMQSCVKIGVTKDLSERMRSLDQPSSVPLPFVCLYAAKVPNARAWERVLHEVFSESRINRKREFFHSDVTAKAALILQTAKLEDVTSTAPSVAQIDETPAETKRQASRRENFSFQMLQIEDGELLQFLSDESVVCMVSQQKPPKVLYEDAEMTLTEAAAQALGRDSTRGIQGSLYWKYQGKTLVERRHKLESDDDNEDTE